MCRCCSTRAGSTFTQYVLEERYGGLPALTDRGAARSLISAIAYECGFTDLSNFNRAFRRRFGATPSDIRIGAATAVKRSRLVGSQPIPSLISPPAPSRDAAEIHIGSNPA